MRTALVVWWSGELGRTDQCADLLSHQLDLVPESGVELNLPTHSGAVIVHGSPNDSYPEHFFKAEGLGTELNRLVIPPTLAPGLVLDREYLITLELDQVRPPNQSQAIGPEGKAVLAANVAPRFPIGFVHTLVVQNPSDREDVIVEDLLNVDQRALPRTVAEVLQG